MRYTLLPATLFLAFTLGCSGDDSSSSASGGTAGTGGTGGGAGGAAGSSGAGTGGTAGASGSGAAAGAGGAGGAGGATGKPYGHVQPSDVGVSLGSGVTGAEPTSVYSGPMTVTSPAVIENVVINGCLVVDSDDVTIRNVVINCNGLYPVKATGHKNLTIEYSTIKCGSMSKVFLVQDYQDMTVNRNEITGCEDFFFVGGQVDGLNVTYNYMHTLNLTPASHADGFQIGEASATTGQITVRGNYIDPDAAGGKTDVIFATNQAKNQIVIEDNFFAIWGLKTLRCGGEAQCFVKHNVFAQGFQQMNQPGWNGKLLFMAATSPNPSSFVCNRLEDGSLVVEMDSGVDRVGGADHVITGCPSP
ncbi:MAG TPA: right-handed parallel beta-helix repeat-containing protein [Polyangiaceae bacterium]|nr:right-handed parallel beta-helix repeat-containing protein [Polyangiaceae bacterium]